RHHKNVSIARRSLRPACRGAHRRSSTAVLSLASCGARGRYVVAPANRGIPSRCFLVALARPSAPERGRHCSGPAESRVSSGCARRSLLAARPLARAARRLCGIAMRGIGSDSCPGSSLHRGSLSGHHRMCRGRHRRDARASLRAPAKTGTHCRAVIGCPASTINNISMADTIRDTVILGSGCAGLTAAIYAARANLKPLVLEGHEPGGQLSITTLVENFPGFPEGIQGPQLIENMKQQATRFGAEFQMGHLATADLSKRPLALRVGAETIHTRTLIIASGASARWLGLPSEQALIGHGVSSCATCDGFAFTGKEIAVIGGGDSAMEEA